MKNTKTKHTPKKITFVDAVKNFWAGYVDFNGRTTRREYWYAVLFVVLLSALVGILFGGIIGTVMDAIMFLPMITMTVRRYRDVGISGWFYVVPVVIFMIWAAIRQSMWISLLNLDYFAPDAIVYLIALLCFVVSNIIICCMPSK